MMTLDKPESVIDWMAVPRQSGVDTLRDRIRVCLAQLGLENRSRHVSTIALSEASDVIQQFWKQQQRKYTNINDSLGRLEDLRAVQKIAFVHGGGRYILQGTFRSHRTLDQGLGFAGTTPITYTIDLDSANMIMGFWEQQGAFKSASEMNGHKPLEPLVRMS